MEEKPESQRRRGEKLGMLLQKEKQSQQQQQQQQNNGHDDKDEDEDDDINGGSICSSTKKAEEVTELAAMAIKMNLRLRSSDMPPTMQRHALSFSRSHLDLSSPPNPSHLARALKKEFDSLYGPAWHCVAGKNFGSFVTHSPGGFIYFSIDSLSVLLFKTKVLLLL